MTNEPNPERDGCSIDQLIKELVPANLVERLEAALLGYDQTMAYLRSIDARWSGPMSWRLAGGPPPPPGVDQWEAARKDRDAARAAVWEWIVDRCANGELIVYARADLVLGALEKITAAAWREGRPAFSWGKKELSIGAGRAKRKLLDLHFVGRDLAPTSTSPVADSAPAIRGKPGARRESARDAAIGALLDEGVVPGEGMRWKAFYEAVRERAGGKASSDYGFTDETIEQRAKEALKSRSRS